MRGRGSPSPPAPTPKVTISGGTEVTFPPYPLSLASPGGLARPIPNLGLIGWVQEARGRGGLPGKLGRNGQRLGNGIVLPDAERLLQESNSIDIRQILTTPEVSGFFCIRIGIRYPPLACCLRSCAKPFAQGRNSGHTRPWPQVGANPRCFRSRACPHTCLFLLLPRKRH